MSNKIEIKTPADLLAHIQAMGTAQITALNGLLDKVPENFKADYIAMRDRLNTLLSGLKPLEQVPAAGEAAYALNSFAETITSIFGYADELKARLAQLTSDLEAKATALNGLNDQVAKGELVSKDKVLIAVDDAVKTAVAPLTQQIATLRQSAVALCGLPEAPEGVLALASEAFTGKLDQAKKNLAALNEKGLTLSGKGGGFVRKSVWLDAEAFNGECGILEDLAPGLKLNLGAGGDPMKGAPGGTPAPAAAPAPAAPKFVVA